MRTPFSSHEPRTRGYVCQCRTVQRALFGRIVVVTATADVPQQCYQRMTLVDGRRRQSPYLRVTHDIIKLTQGVKHRQMHDCCRGHIVG